MALWRVITSNILQHIGILSETSVRNILGAPYRVYRAVFLYPFHFEDLTVTLLQTWTAYDSPVVFLRCPWLLPFWVHFHHFSFLCWNRFFIPRLRSTKASKVRTVRTWSFRLEKQYWWNFDHNRMVYGVRRGNLTYAHFSDESLFLDVWDALFSRACEAAEILSGMNLERCVKTCILKRCFPSLQFSSYKRRDNVRLSQTSPWSSILLFWVKLRPIHTAISILQVPPSKLS